MMGLALLLVVISLSVLLHYFSLRYAVANDSPYLRSLLVSLQAQENERAQSYLRESLNTMASKLGELQARTGELNRDTLLVVHCKGGYRSSIATSLLRRAGFVDIANLTGGFDAWKTAALPVVVPDASRV